MKSDLGNQPSILLKWATEHIGKVSAPTVLPTKTIRHHGAHLKFISWISNYIRNWKQTSGPTVLWLLKSALVFIMIIFLVKILVIMSFNSLRKLKKRRKKGWKFKISMPKDVFKRQLQEPDELDLQLSHPVD